MEPVPPYRRTPRTSGDTDFVGPEGVRVVPAVEFLRSLVCLGEHEHGQVRAARPALGDLIRLEPAQQATLATSRSARSAVA